MNDERTASVLVIKKKTQVLASQRIISGLSSSYHLW